MKFLKFLESSRERRNTKKHTDRLKEAVACAIESLEQRMLLTGSWTALVHQPGNASTMLLLPNGTVMAQGYDKSKTWNRLTPDASGSYVNGTWSALASSAVGREYYASAVIPDGRVVVVGGEYTTEGGGEANRSNTGEIYNPQTNTWAAIANYPTANAGDVMSEVLADGTLLVQNIYSGQTYRYDPIGNTWSTNALQTGGDHGSEESWVKLRDGSILNYQIGTTPPHGERWIPGATHAQDQWIDAGVVPHEIDAGTEIGGAFLLADGRAIFFGANGKTEIYTPPATLMGTGSWADGPDIKDSAGTLYGVWDGPGAVLPNGKILFDAGTTTYYDGPTHMFEFDPLANSGAGSITEVPSSALSLGGYEFETRMLMLPSGQVLVVDTAHQLWIYTEDAAPLAAGKPTVTNIVANGTQFTLTGTQLNGISEGAGYGDDAQMASNYPIVRVTSGFGTVSFGRTFSWSSNWVQTGSTPVTTQFTGVNVGAYLLAVIANGIASDNTLYVQMGAGADNIIIRVNPGDSTQVQVLQNPNTLLGTFAKTSFTQIIVAGDSTNSTLTVDATNGSPIPTGGMRYNGDGGTNRLNVTGTSGNDSATISTTTFNLNAGLITYSSVQQIEFDGNAGNDTATASVSIPVTLNGGSGLDILQGGSGNDSISGGTENDSLVGGAGADLLMGDGGNDTLRGDMASGAANFRDTLYGGSENDILYGDSNGSFAYGYAYEMDTLYGDAGDDTIYGDGGDGYGAGVGHDLIEGGAGNDSLVGENGDDTYVFAGSSDLGTDTVNDIGSSTAGDLLDFSNHVGAINVNLASTANQTVSSILHLVLTSASSIERVNGSASNDTITGNTLANTIQGNAGNDLIYGGAGNDSLSGGADVDWIFAQAGNDTVHGDAGNDACYGGLGNDYVYGDDDNDGVHGGDQLEQADGNDVLSGGNGIDRADYQFDTHNLTLTIDGVANDGEVGETDNILTDVENVWGGAGDDNITGNGGPNELRGNAGADVISGGAGNDTIDGGIGNDNLLGEADNDLINGYDGDDIITGGTGNDTMNGGMGADHFFAADGFIDTIDGGFGDGVNDILESSDGNDVLLNMP